MPLRTLLAAVILLGCFARNAHAIRLDQIIARAVQMNREIAQAVEARRAARDAELRAVGIQGARLALFVNEDADWYLPGCVLSTNDPARLKAAKTLFQWVTAPNGAITIRRFTFAGDNYSFSEWTTRDASKARALCR